jgi:hypothetical protein
MKRIASRALVGLGLGLGFAVMEFVVVSAAENVFHDHTVAPMRFLYSALGILNAPADWLGHLWIDVWRLPPRGEEAWIIVPVTAALVQWGLIGLVGGLWWGCTSRLSAGKSDRRFRPILLGVAGVVVACGLLATTLAVVCNRPAKPGPSTAPSGANAAAAEQSQLDEATRAVAANPMDAQAHCRLGVALAGLHRLDEAMAHFRKALEIQPTCAEAHYQLGVALAGLHRLDAAIAQFQQALTLQPDYPEARRELNEALKTRQ